MIYIRASVVFFEGLVSDETLGEGLDRSLDNSFRGHLYVMEPSLFKKRLLI